MKRFASIILSKNYSFANEGLAYFFNDEKESINIGDVVLVPFGSKRLISGLVVDLYDESPNIEKIKEISRKLNVFFDKKYIDVAKDVSKYYFASLFSCIRLFIPNKIWSGEFKEKKDVFWSLSYNFDCSLVRGKNQLKIINVLNKKKQLEQSQLLEKSQASVSSLKNLEEKDCITKKEDIVCPETFEIEMKAFKVLSKEQTDVFEKLKLKNVSLLHGVTGSGKTEVFLHFFRWIFKKDSSAQNLFLVPEISLTPQMIEYFKKAFPKNIAVIHSKISEGEKCRIWLGIQRGEIKLVIGSRSSLFLPWKNLRSIIIDEEHEWTYKSEQTPRYNTKWIAEKILEKHKDNKKRFLILSSATPDVCDVYRAKTNEIQYLELKRRFGDIELPPVTIIDMRKEFLKKNFSPFSEYLTNRIKSTLEKKKQIILFLNKRGFSKSLQCKECGEIVMCPHCSVPLTHHKDVLKGKEKLICHYCFLVQEVLITCPKCSSYSINFKGSGTQKIESILETLFPNAKVLRADKDTTMSKDHFLSIYEKMKNGEADILLGTQMISKGLDLPNIDLVGVISADSGLHIPDFCAGERAFQTLMQVAGRTGRKNSGEVVFQTFQPFHEVIQSASLHNYEKMYQNEIETRKLLKYPPFSKLIKLIFTDYDKKIAMNEGQRMLKILKEKKEMLDLSPDTILSLSVAPAFVPKMHNKYHWHIIIRGDCPEKVLENVDLGKWRVDRDPILLS